MNEIHKTPETQKLSLGGAEISFDNNLTHEKIKALESVINNGSEINRAMNSLNVFGGRTKLGEVVQRVEDGIRDGARLKRVLVENGVKKEYIAVLQVYYKQKGKYDGPIDGEMRVEVAGKKQDSKFASMLMDINKKPQEPQISTTVASQKSGEVALIGVPDKGVAKIEDSAKSKAQETPNLQQVAQVQEPASKSNEKILKKSLKTGPKELKDLKKSVQTSVTGGNNFSPEPMLGQDVFSKEFVNRNRNEIKRYADAISADKLIYGLLISILDGNADDAHIFKLQGYLGMPQIDHDGRFSDKTLLLLKNYAQMHNTIESKPSLRIIESSVISHISEPTVIPHVEKNVVSKFDNLLGIDPKVKEHIRKACQRANSPLAYIMNEVEFHPGKVADVLDKILIDLDIPERKMSSIAPAKRDEYKARIKNYLG